MVDSGRRRNFQAEDGIRDWSVTGVQTCALPISDQPHDPGRADRAAGDGDGLPCLPGGLRAAPGDRLLDLPDLALRLDHGGGHLLHALLATETRDRKSVV